MKLQDLYKPQRVRYGIVLSIIVLEYIVDLGSMYAFTYSASKLFNGEFKLAFLIYLVCAGLNMLQLVVDYVAKLNLNQVVKFSMMEYRTHMIALMKNSTKKIDENDFISALNNDTNQIKNGIMTKVTLFEALTMSVMSLIGLAYLSWELALLSCVAFFVVHKCNKPIRDMASEVEENRSSVLSKYLKRSSDLIQGFSVFNVYNRKKQFAKLLGLANTEVEKEYLEMNTKSTLVDQGAMALSHIAQILSMVVAFVLLYYGRCSVAIFVSQGNYSGGIHTGMYRYSSTKAQVSAVDHIVEMRCVEILEEDTTVQEVEHFDLVVDNLTFGYEDQPVLENCSYTFEEGKKYMIIGGSGSGKSTLLKLLSKELEGQEGSITLGGKSYAELNPASVHTYVGYVDQSPYIFNDTVLANITLHGNVEESRLESAIERSKVKDFMDDLNQVIELNGENLSGGQKQRLSIARELVSEHKIILFDEVNSSLDKELNVALVETLVKLNETVLFVAHNYDEYTCSLFDEVIDLKKIQTAAGGVL